MSHRNRSCALVVGALLLFACGPTAASGGDTREVSPQTRGAGDEAPPPETRTPTRRADARQLALQATFGDLAAAARRQDELRDSESLSGCLLRSGADTFRLEADLAVAVRPLPAAPDDLDERLSRSAAPPRVLSRFSSYGPDDARMGLSAITTTRPPRGALGGVLFVTDQGLYVRRTDAAASAPGTLALDAALAALADVETLFVSAEAGVPLTRLSEVLAAVPESFVGRIGLALVLDGDVRLPAPPVQAADASGAAAPLCPTGLPELTEDGPEDGDLALEDIQRGLAPLASIAGSCIGATTGPGAGGTHVVIAMRVGPGGRVSAACAMEDSAGDAALRACLVRGATELSFADPHGVLDLALPMDLAPGPPYRQAALCH